MRNLPWMKKLLCVLVLSGMIGCEKHPVSQLSEGRTSENADTSPSPGVQASPSTSPPSYFPK
jgi:hypothetical protein